MVWKHNAYPLKSLMPDEIGNGYGDGDGGNGAGDGFSTSAVGMLRITQSFGCEDGDGRGDGVYGNAAGIGYGNGLLKEGVEWASSSD